MTIARKIISTLAGALLLLAPVAGKAAPNVLFITIDDLRPDLGCYGASQVVSPNMDRLAARGMVFRRAYSQQALCNPSRASFLTGLRPDSTGVYDLVTHFRKKVPDVTTLPQHFKNHGYHSQAIGKIFHPAFASFGIGSDLGDEPSWSEPAWLGNPRYYYSPLGVRLAREAYNAALKAGPSGSPNWVAEVLARRAQRGTPGTINPEPDDDEWTQVNVRVLATEAPDVDDSVLLDGEVTNRAIASLQAFKHRDDRRPFFLAVGFLRPHLPFIAPRKYWDLYDPKKIDVADNPRPPLGAPALALAVPMDELRDTYPKDVRYRPANSPADESQPYDLPRNGPLTKEQQVQLRHGYYACISFIDAQIGRLVAELDRLDLADDTIVTIVGDHGFSLGEHGLWGKLTNFEDATRSPLIICVPGKTGQGQQTNALVELVDIYPTLCELAGLPLPPHLEGVSAAPLLDDPDQPWKTAAFSQYPRSGFMGYTMRTERYRFTRWQSATDPDVVGGVELYDHGNNPHENVNLATSAENAVLIKELSRKLRDSNPRVGTRLSL